ncbi:MAG: Fic family protein [Nanoarchaeota archaeon]|nr:Fic family protein [Nanoarchaeota archaeon]
MPTRYDVFSEIIEYAPCKAKDLPFKKPVYVHLNKLVKEGLIKKTNSTYVPIKNEHTFLLFKIIKYCLKNGLGYNKILSKNMPLVIRELFKSAPNIRPLRLKANKENTELMKYLEENQFVLITKKRPKKGIILQHQLFGYVLKLSGISYKFSLTKFKNIQEEVFKLKSNPLNPFDDKIFQFLTGSAQLEGGTITSGETRELILKDIYPDKPKKDIQMVKNLNEAMHYVLENLDEEILAEHIKEINKRVMFSLHRGAGKYKLVQNKIQGNPTFKTASPNKVPKLVEEFCLMLKEIKTKKECLMKLGYIHNEFQRIHPFSDGNSRTIRMILSWVLLKHKIPLLVLKMGCFDEYMNLTKLSSRRDDERLMKLFHHLLIHESLLE